VSTTYAGYLSDYFGSPFAFLGLTGIALVGLVAMWALMPETGPSREERPQGTRVG
jgi:predicted MFS family arabinose efflux permease